MNALHVGKWFTSLVVKKQSNTKCICKCLCGKTLEVKTTDLKLGKKHSCGCGITPNINWPLQGLGDNTE